MEVQKSQNLSFKALYMPNAKSLKYTVENYAAKQIENLRPRLEEMANYVDIYIEPRTIQANTTIFEIKVDKPLNKDITHFSDLECLKKPQSDFAYELRKSLTEARIEAYKKFGLTNEVRGEILVSNIEISKKLIAYIKKLKQTFFENRDNNDEVVRKYLKNTKKLDI